jgi:hypothetical protein
LLCNYYISRKLVRNFDEAMPILGVFFSLKKTGRGPKEWMIWSQQGGDSPDGKSS